MNEEFNVVIAEDEKRICSLIKALIDWDGLHLRLVGEAHDGVQALSLIHIFSAYRNCNNVSTGTECKSAHKLSTVQNLVIRQNLCFRTVSYTHLLPILRYNLGSP